MTKIVLGSIDKPGFLIEDDGKLLVSTEYNPGEKYESKVKFFASTDEAEQFIKEHNFWALEPIELPVDRE